MNLATNRRGSRPFLDTLIVRKPNGSIKLMVYRKPTHTDQYLNFESQHPLHQKLGVIRTLLDRMHTIVTEDLDKEQEEVKIRQALKNCGYPQWTVDKVKEQMSNKASKTKKERKKKDDKKSAGMVVLPYIQGITERIQRTFKKYNINTAMRPHNTLRRLLVHPKDKRDTLQTSNCIYEIPCKNCEKSYVGETSRLFGIRLAEHKAETKKVDTKKFTRSGRRASEQEQTKSAISDHAARSNHVIDWDEARILGKEHNRRSREVREAMEIRKRGDKTFNREEGTFLLSHVYDPLLKRTGNSGNEVSRHSGSMPF